MTPASVCASCGRGTQGDLKPADGSLLCGSCAQRLQLSLVDLMLYRRQRPAGPVPCFTGPQGPAEVLRFTARERHHVGAE